MKLTRLYAKNFMSFRELDISLEDVNMLMIEGWNHDDNSASGSGKTAIMDLSSFVWFGESPRDIKADEFLNDDHPKECIGITEFQTEKGILKITRTRKPNDLFWTDEEGIEHRGTDIKETQKEISSLLKLDFNTFCNCIYFAANPKSKFVSATDTEKREVLTRILDLEIYDKAYEKTQKLLKENEDKIKYETSNLENINNILSITTNDYNEANLGANTFENNKTNEIASKTVSVKMNSDKSNKIKELLVGLKEDLSSLVPQEVPSPDLSSIDSQIESLRNKEYGPEPVKPEEPDLSSYTSQLEELNKKVALKDTTLEKRSELRKELGILEYQKKDYEKKLQKASSLEGGSTCDSCDQLIPHDHVEELKVSLEGHLTALNKSIEDLKAKDIKITGLIDKIAGFERQVKEIENIKRQAQTTYQTELNNYNKAIIQMKDLKSKIDKQISDLEARKVYEVSKYEKALVQAENDFKLQQNKISAKISESEQELRNIENNMKRDLEDIKVIKKRENPFIKMCESKSLEVNNIKESMVKINDDINELNLNAEALLRLKDAYKNIKYWIFESTIDELNMRMVKYTDPLFGEDVKIEFKYISGKDLDKLKFETEITKNNKVKSFNSLSEGEKRRVELATNFALSDIVAGNKGSVLNFMMLDEVFGNLDAECVGRVVSLLEMFKTEKDQILVIDHFEATKNMIDSTIKVEKHNAVSSIV